MGYMVPMLCRMMSMPGWKYQIVFKNTLGTTHMSISGADPGVGKGKGTNRLSVARWLKKINFLK